MTPVITGLGATTPLGGTVSTTWQAALAGTSGVKPLPSQWLEQYGLPIHFAARLAVPPQQVLPPMRHRKLDPAAQAAVVAAAEAWADAGAPEVPGERLAVVVGTGIGGVWTLLNAWDTVRERGADRVLPMTVPMLMPNSAAANISVELGARAGAHTPASACASGAEALAWAVQLIRGGHADVVVAGGCEAAIHPMPLAAFAKMRALSLRNDDPQAASRPFSLSRDGFVMGEGAAMLVLESPEHARARGATVYANLAGVAITADAYDVAPPDPSGQGQRRAIELALADADLCGSDIVHVNAHATATPVGDGIEAAAIAQALATAGAPCQALVSGTKSMTGHLLGGAGALETVFTVLALRDRLAPPTINLDDPDPSIELRVVGDRPADLPRSGQLAALNNAFGFGGHNVALVLTSA
ncbi:MAG: beta-ketoacyl-[acyl-carrier-protein] synthase family protein [Bifidobacteriaceae bacterium]|jgi:3-oxoacyl-[acyl-carrier-protein] synthase II|nr:beta-ketoacyl-[acyl-carrier-protein] synthase family protein [Bifidobacteriaceae bacterium]